MGFLSGKALILAGTLFTTASVGAFAYDGSETLNGIKSKISFQSEQIVKYDNNQASLINKVKQLQQQGNEKIGKANAFIDKQKVTILETKKEIIALNGKINEMTITIEKNNTTIKGLEKSLAEVGNNFNALEKKYNDLLASNNATLAELADTKGKLDAANSIIKELKDEIAKLQAALAQATTDLKDTKDTLTQTKYDLLNETKKYNEAIAERDMLQIELDLANKVQEEVKAELDKANKANEDANAEVKKANVDVANFGAEVNSILTDLEAQDITNVLNLELDDVKTDGKFN